MKVSSLLRHKVVQAGSWYIVTNIFVKGIGFLTIPIFTRILSVEDYGIVAVYTAWVGILSVFMSLDLIWSVNLGKVDFKQKFDDYISSVLTLSLLLFSIFGILMVLLHNPISSFIDINGPIYFFMIIHAYFLFVQRFALAKFRVEYKYKLVSITSIFAALVGVLISIYLINRVFINQEYVGKILGGGFVIIVLGIGYTIYFFYKGNVFINTKYWKHALGISTPFIFHNLAGIINSQFDRLVINQYSGAAATGIYSFAYNIGMIILIVRTSFAQAYKPYFLEKAKLGNRERILQSGVLIRDTFTILYALILFLSPEVIRIMAPEAFWEGLFIIPFIFIAYYFEFMTTFETYTQYYHRNTKYKALGSLLAAGINISLNLIFVPRYGYSAAAITTAITFFILFTFHFAINRLIIKDSMYGLRFHIRSIVYISLITGTFFIIEDKLLLRIMVILLASLYCAVNLRKYKLM
ncbi:lipopolysaccharide biosynthesis protein [Isachenkonia alkalipeptolytica]|uniref:Polysaccharide biosynthesis protein C-terminal domain-containing protein n=1 Tax=Isachenkonia alkalipeptolytica TaxID=2565777 RepID=A0AA43XPU7_9CLOT|nr:oligosaccharide flippase family protein [Isachenkonia alkalipeptolytica]NBG89525.1 hypothetical protein [Isachenkonia alkalipeptolytica]